MINFNAVLPTSWSFFQAVWHNLP